MLDSPHGKKPRISNSEPDEETDVKIERFLLQGLDYYFKKEFERAIEIWSRVLFLDRGHIRAQAYIEKARSAVAERIRESEESFFIGAEAFNRGDITKARELLSAAVKSGVNRDEVLTLLDRLDRLEMASGEFRQEKVSRHLKYDDKEKRASLDSRKSGWFKKEILVAVSCLFIFCSVGVLWFWGPDLLWNSEEWSPEQKFSVSALDEDAGLQLLSVSDITLRRAEREISNGRYFEALRLLELISPGEAGSDEANRLKAKIQGELLGID